MLSHIGKAWAKAPVRPHVPAVGKVTGPCQFGSLPGRSTRDAIDILENVVERFTNSNHQANRRSCLFATPVTKVHVTTGVRQGSVEGPLGFILLYTLTASESHCGGFTWEHSEQIGTSALWTTG